MTRESAVIDKQDITELLYRYCRALDERDWVLLEECFVAEPEFDADGFPLLTSFAGIRDSASTALAGLDSSQHFVTNIMIDLQGDEAAVVSYLQAQHVRAAAGADPNFLVAGIYRDVARRTREGWRFARRSLEVLWTDGNPDVPTGTVANRVGE